MSRNNWRQHESSNSSTTASARSDSDRSSETEPTEYSFRPPLPQHETCYGRVEGRGQEYFDYDPPASSTARASVDTYASTSEEDLADDFDDVPEYDVPQYAHDVFPVDAIPTTPCDFADLFPTTKRISIRHDDSTIDGNMNLRVDTQVEMRHKKQNCTLFHLRMHDLRTREFSLRRYCRESGREVCHSIRKYQKLPSEKRPVLQRASTALASLRHKPDSRPSTAAGLKRSDSGYESMAGAEDEHDSRPKSAGYAKGRALLPTNTLKLEFSNYAHIDVKRRGAKSNKRYGFEYWGHAYSWKRVVKKNGDHESVSYYLVRADNEKQPLAHISPVKMTHDQAHEEAARGGWIPPCYMRMTDDRLLNAATDISDVVVATGLIALVDDCIKRRFHTKQSTQLHIPLMRNASFKMNMEYVGPKRLIDEVFHRTSRSGPPSRHPPALRRTSIGA
ncbi:uncharacterized protein BDR25DRAFT_331523 [Lindgomyces ingoldianus]|uniref:Uncharacterized protein n=1 Tax=Lindgomyces ingoldianus TaxID=673940 RepID=A0ACB6RBP2_9PLEO|nr:uncharacterized protein BDR25DRAFT_331523 [Lindgomyces ingoldianus]KAF2475747.1 hypothetical protein BDR25DRAFT_331523 [Lindgomyces ingoldianus]